MKLGWTLGFFALFLSATLWGNMLSPLHGPPDTEVTVTPAGIDPGAVTAARIGASVAEILGSTEDSVFVRIPADAVSGPIELLWEGGSWVSNVEFEVTRMVPVTVESGYSWATHAGSLFGDAIGGSVEVAVSRSNLLFAWDGGDSAVLLAIATDHDDAVTFDAATTARAAVFLSYLVYTADSDEATGRLAMISEADGFEALAGLIKDETESGRDYSTNSQFPELLEQALAGYLSVQGFADTPETGPAAAPAAESSYAIRDLYVDGYQLLDRIQPTTHSGGLDRSSGLPVFLQKFDAAPVPDETFGQFLTANPLEWTANLYRLDEYDLRLDNPSKVSALTGSNTAVYRRWNPHPLDRMIVGSKPITRYLNIVDLAKDWLVGKAIQQSNALTEMSVKDSLSIPADEPGIYMVRAFSGARYPPRDALVDGLPGGRGEHTKMTALNLVLAVNDAIGMFFSAQDAVSQNEWAKFLVGLEKNIGDALDLEAAQGTLNAEAFNTIFQKSTATALGWIWDQITSAGIRQLPSRLAAVAKTSVDVSGKAANAFKLTERIVALGNAVQIFDDNAFMVQSVEDTLIVVGDPWAPSISSFSPHRGHRGTFVTITGEGFSWNAGENIVTIGLQGTSPSDPPEPARAEVIEASDQSLLVRIPEDAGTGAITVHVTGSGTASSNGLDPPFQQFEVIPDPVITSAETAGARPGDLVRILGDHFPVAMPDLYAVFTGTEDRFAEVIQGSATELITTLPGGISEPASVRVVFEDRQSNAIEVSITPTLLPPLGATIYVSSLADNNVRDGKITLREALMLANGTLAYSELTTVPETGRPQDATYETDYLGPILFFKQDGDDRVGPGFRNGITNYLFQPNDTIELSAPLPPVTDWTIIGLSNDPIIEGNGIPVGLLLDGTKRAQVSGLKLRNFSDAAIRLTGESSDNNIFGVSVDGGAGHGVHLIGNAARNHFLVAVRNVGGHGYYFDGEDVMMNQIVIGKTPEGATGFIAFCDGWGVLVSGGARFNRFIPPPVSIVDGFDPSGGIIGNGLGGILVTGDTSTGNQFGNEGGTGIPIRDNLAQGIRIESPETIVQFCRIGWNDGSGIEIVGPHSRGTSVYGCSIGFDLPSGEAQRNDGHGIHVSASSEIRLGSEGSYWYPFPFPNRIGANTGNGIFIENSSAVSIKAALIGRVTEGAAAPVDFPNELSGIVLLDSDSCTLGSVWPHSRVQVTGHVEGAGVRIGGIRSFNNVVLGAFIGCEAEIGPDAIEGFAEVGETDLGNLIGIEITDGAYSNRIGLGGNDERWPTTTPLNRIFFNRKAGIVLDSAFDPTQSIPPGDSPFTPLGRNIVVNNAIQKQHENGILIRAEAKANQVGSGRWWESNRIRDNGKAGIRIEGATATRPELGNRILGNFLRGNGRSLPAAADPLTGEAEGIGILLLNASRQQIGGTRPEEANAIYDSWVGLMIQGGSGNMVAGNYVGWTTWTATDQQRHRRASVLLRDTIDNRIGPGNAINGGGVSGQDPLGGIVISGGGGNRVFGNIIGLWPTGVTSDNTPDGLVLRETVDNIIGGFGNDGNVIVNSSGYGVRITGNTSTGNRVSGNWIGRNPGPGLPVQPNLLGGIHIEEGARSNQIGGLLPLDFNGTRVMLPAGNTIEHNGSVGVRVSGNAASNTVTYNHITSNAGSGIVLAGGNRMQPAPLLNQGSPGFINGSSEAPDGSLVQFFSDPAGEGRTLLGERIVKGGIFTFRIPDLVGPGELTATVTNGDTGDTSEFSSPVPIIADLLNLLVARIGEPINRTAGETGSNTLILPMELSVLGESSVRVHAFKFILTGDSLESAELVRGGELVAAGTIDLEGNVVFSGTPELAVVEPGFPVLMDLSVRLKSGVLEGQGIQLALNGPEDVDAKLISGSFTAPVEGMFPIFSDRVVHRFQTFDEWGLAYGVDVTGPDRNALFLSYVAGSDPNQPGRHPTGHIGIIGPPSVRNGDFEATVTYAERGDVVIAYMKTSDLRNWTLIESGAIEILETTPDGLSRVKIRFPTNASQLFLRAELKNLP